MPIVIILILIIIAIIACNIRIVPQTFAYVIERLGCYQTTWEVGLHVKIPFIDRIARKVSLKEQVVDFPPQPVITEDNVTMQIDTVVYYQITDPKLYAYGVENPMMAIENLTATTLRNIIGDLELDETLTSRDTINTRMRAILDEATDPWGIKVNRVELKNVMPPADIQNAILRAEAKKEAAIKEAEGKAEAILKIQEANAAGIKLINEADPQQGYLTLKSLESLNALADGKSTKIVVPSNIQGLAGLATSLSEVVKPDDAPAAKK